MINSNYVAMVAKDLTKAAEKEDIQVMLVLFDILKGHMRNQVDSERDEILSELPRESSIDVPRDWTPNARVFLDQHDRLSILPVGGGWLGAKIEDLEADLAPFSD
jgi:hypothetical protein